MSCYRKDGCGPYETYSCLECPASKPEYVNRYTNQKAVAADVIEVVRGEWIRPTKINGRTFDIPHCSVCGDVPCDTKNYCPNCGAKMDGRRTQ